MKKAIIIGGSLSGLMAGTVLRSIGWEVDIFERSPAALESRGAGMVIQPAVEKLFSRIGLDPDRLPSIWTRERVQLGKDGSVLSRSQERQRHISWSDMYQALLNAFPRASYHRGNPLLSCRQDRSSVTAILSDGTVAEADLLLGADGSHSLVRSLFFPDAPWEYAGYVAWQGLVPEASLDPETSLRERFVFQQGPGCHFVAYPVPGRLGGAPDYSWMWFVCATPGSELPTILTDRYGHRHATTVPPGRVAPAVANHMRERAARLLCPDLKALVEATPHPFVHSIGDMACPCIAMGRVALLGEAAFCTRPHTAGSAAKAATNAMDLADALLREQHEVKPALHRWEGPQMALGRAVVLAGHRYWEGQTDPKRQRSLQVL